MNLDRIHSHISRLARASAFLLLLLASACFTASEVRDIVKSSNLAMAGGVLMPDEPDVGAEASRIAAFIRKHPGKAMVTDPLWVRQALLHLRNGDFNLAEKAFAAVSDRKNLSPRDRALVSARGALVFRFRYGPEELSSTERAEAQKSLPALATAANEPDAPSGVRIYLLSEHARLALQMEKDLPKVKTAKAGLEKFATLFDEADAKWFKKHLKKLFGANPPKMPKAPGLAARRARAISVLREFGQIAKAGDIDPIRGMDDWLQAMFDEASR